jgi:hypothetical protein
MIGVEKQQKGPTTMLDTQYYYLRSIQEVRQRAQEILGADTQQQERRCECRPMEGNEGMWIALAQGKRWVVAYLRAAWVRRTSPMQKNYP